MPALINKNPGGTFHQINEVLIVARVALALAVLFEGDEYLGETRAHGRRDKHIANRLIPPGQSTMNESAGRQQSIAFFYDVTRKAKKIIHAKREIVVIIYASGLTNLPAG